MPVVVEAKYTDDGRPEFEAADLKELQACARGPEILTPQEEDMVQQRREAGNAAFRAGRIEEALRGYNQSLEIFADRHGGPEQRQLKSKLYANRAECLLRLSSWEAAEKAARLALELDATNAKARYRLARALEQLGGEAHLHEALAQIDQLRLPTTARPTAAAAHDAEPAAAASQPAAAASQHPAAAEGSKPAAAAEGSQPPASTSDAGLGRAEALLLRCVPSQAQ